MNAYTTGSHGAATHTASDPPLDPTKRSRLTPDETRPYPVIVGSLAIVLIVAAGLIAGALMLPMSAAAHHLPAIWIGSPVNGTWGLPGDRSTVPPYHHRVRKVSPSNDWSVDLSRISTADLAVYVYAAPQNTAYNSRVTARVTQIIDNDLCSAGGGGDLVTVGFWIDSTLIGRATYAHLDRNASLRVGSAVARWGGYLGQVARLTGGATGGSNCWTGPHAHFELRSEKHYACWNKGYAPGYPVKRTNFVGFIGGGLDPHSARACP